MSKGLEALYRLANNHREEYLEKDNNLIEDVKTIEKELKALEIIISKNVQIILLKNTKDFETYNKMLGAAFNKKDIKKMSLTQEEYDLFKEVLL